jgi:O-antigen/teichoic acid export membrane protein
MQVVPKSLPKGCVMISDTGLRSPFFSTAFMSTSFRQKVLSGLFWSLLQSWGVRFGSLAIFMVLARLLDPQAIGVFSAASSVIAFFALFVESGLSEAIVQRPEVTRPQLNSAFVVNMGLALLAVLLLWLGAELVCDYMHMPQLLWVLRVCSLGMIISAATFSQQAMYRREFQYKLLATVSIVATLVSGLLALAMAYSGAGTWSLVVQAMVSAVITAVALWWRSSWHFELDFDFAGMRALLSYGLKRLATTLMDFVNTRFIEFLCAVSLGAAGLGLYAVGVRIYQALMQSLSYAMLDIAHNAFSRLAHDRPAMLSGYYKAMSASAAVAVPVFVIAAALSPELTAVVFGDKWGGAADVMRPMLLLGAVQVLQFYNGIAYNALGRPGIGLAFMVVKTVITLVSLLFVKNEALPVIVLTYVLSQLSITPLSFGVVRQVMGVSMRQLVRSLGGFLLAAVAAYAAVVLARPFALEVMPVRLGALVLLSGVGALSYGAIVLLLARRQLMDVVSMFKRRSS